MSGSVVPRYSSDDDYAARGKIPSFYSNQAAQHESARGSSSKARRSALAEPSTAAGLRAAELSSPQSSKIG
jgi:hypothetical protein